MDKWGKKKPGKSQKSKAGAQKVTWTKNASNEKAMRLHRNRKKVALELWDTEKSYVKSLDIICEHFQAPLLLALKKGKPILPLKEIQLIFSDIATMRDLNSKFLSDLESKVKDYTINTKLGDILLQFVPFFKMYRQYVENTEHTRVKDIMKLLGPTAGNSAFKKFCDNKCKEIQCLPLPALLITPVQRIPRYRLLVQEYIKHTSDTHPDYSDLKKALTSIKETATYVNNSIRQSQNRAKILEISSNFPKDPGFISPTLTFKHDSHSFLFHSTNRFEGNLTKKSRKTDLLYRFFLFNDMLAYAKEASVGRYVLHKKIPVDSTFELRDLQDASEPHSFQLFNSVKSFQVYATSANEKKEWMQAITGVINEYIELRNSLKNGDLKSAMAVLQTEKKKYCQRQYKKNGMPCKQMFGMFKSRHNCHKCGVLCCESCAPFHVYLNKGDSKKHRVCTICIRLLIDMKENKKLYKLKDLPPPQDSPTGSVMAQWNEAQTLDSAVPSRSVSRRMSRSRDGASSRNSIDAKALAVHGMLRVSVIKAEDLIISDSRTPDPYVRLSTNDGVQVVSKVIRKSASPEWKQELRLYVERLTEPITIEVLDSGSVSREELIGSAKVFVFDLVNGGQQDINCDIYKVEGSVVSGMVTLTCRFIKALRRKIKRTKGSANLDLNIPHYKSRIKSVTPNPQPRADRVPTDPSYLGGSEEGDLRKAGSAHK